MPCSQTIGPFPCCSVINGDSRELFSRLGDLPAFLVTDPPYGIAHPCDYNKRGRSNAAKCNDYADVAGDAQPFDPRFLLAVDRPTVLWGANHYCHHLPGSSGWLVWDKQRPDTLDQATCEIAWTNYVKGVRRLVWRWNGMIRHPQSREKLVHPTQKPVALTEWIMSLRWSPDDLPIVDPYCGSGSSLVAAKQCGRHYLGFELSPEYCSLAEKWLLNPGKRAGFAKQVQRAKVREEIPPMFALVDGKILFDTVVKEAIDETKID